VLEQILEEEAVEAVAVEEDMVEVVEEVLVEMEIGALLIL
jgi:hypothetical protein